MICLDHKGERHVGARKEYVMSAGNFSKMLLALPEKPPIGRKGRLQGNWQIITASCVVYDV